MQAELISGLNAIASEELIRSFGSSLSETKLRTMTSKVTRAMRDKLDTTSTMDATPRMEAVAAATTTVLLDFFTGPGFNDLTSAGMSLTSIPKFRAMVSSRATKLLDQLRVEYLSGARGNAPASAYLNKTRPMYEFVRLTLGIRMHGSENYVRFVNGLGVEDVTIGQNVSLIHEVISLVSESSNGDLTSRFPYRLFVMARCKVLLFECSHERWAYRILILSTLFPIKKI